MQGSKLMFSPKFSSYLVKYIFKEVSYVCFEEFMKIANQNNMYTLIGCFGTMYHSLMQERTCRPRTQTHDHCSVREASTYL